MLGTILCLFGKHQWASVQLLGKRGRSGTLKVQGQMEVCERCREPRQSLAY